MDENPLQGETGQRGSGRAKFTKPALIALLVLSLTLLSVAIFSPRPRVENAAAPTIEPTHDRLTNKRFPSLRPAALKSQPAPAVTGLLTPRPMRLTKKVLAEKKWDSGPDALGRTLPPGGEGTIVGPTAVAYAGEAIYVLDRSNQRVVVYDETGRMISSVALPGKSFGDLVVNPSDSSVLVIDQIREAIYKVSGTETIDMVSVPLKEFSLGLMFGYDADSGTLYVHSHELGGDIPLTVQGRPLHPSERTVQTLSPVRGDYEEANKENILLKFKDGRELRIGFDLPVQCVEEMTMDRLGIVWVLYTLQGDYQMRRLARVDPVRQTVGVAVLDVFFVYDVARHMAPSGNGIVIVAGDKEAGRLLSFEYSGNL